MTTGTKTPTARRSFLAFLTGVAAAPAAAVAAVPSPAPDVVEAPELLALGRQVIVLEERFDVARARKAEALAIYEQLLPELPSDLVVDYRSRLWPLAEEERGPQDFPVQTADRRRILSSRLMRADIIVRDVSRHTKEGRELRRLVRMAQAYERGVAAARQASKCLAAFDGLHDITIELDRIAWPAVEVAPRTMAGAMIIVRTADLRDAIKREIGGEPIIPAIADLAVAAMARIDRERVVAA